MSDSKRTPKKTVHEWLKEINNLPIVINRFDLIELVEVRQYLNEYQFERFNFINKTINEEYTFEWAVDNISQFGMTYNRILYLMELINFRIKVLNESSLKSLNTRNYKRPNYDNKIFRGNDNDNDNETLFFYCLNNLAFELNRKNVGGLYSWFSSRLNCTKKDFAIYWNAIDTGFKINFSGNNSASLPNEDVETVSKELESLLIEFNKNK